MIKATASIDEAIISLNDTWLAQFWKPANVQADMEFVNEKFRPIVGIIGNSHIFECRINSAASSAGNVNKSCLLINFQK